MDFGIFYEIQVNSPLKHREREAQVFHQVLDQVARAERSASATSGVLSIISSPAFRIVRLPRCSTAR